VKPKHLHIALAGPAGMRIAWKTDAKPTSCMVSARTAANVKEAGADSIAQYLEDHGYHGVATLKDLVPGSSYSYQVICDHVASDRRSFAVPKEGLDKFTMLVVGDMGTRKWGEAHDSKDLMDKLFDSVDLTSIVGDIAYADDSFIHRSECTAAFCYEAIYDQFMEWMEDLISTKPFMVAVGNHESECHSPNCVLNRAHADQLRNFSAYNTRWHMPSPESGGVLNMWFSYDYGPVHFVAVNSETDFPGAAEEHYGDSGRVIGLKAGGFAPDGAYLRWLEADLAKANANRDKVPWIVAYGHRPWFHKDVQEFSPEIAKTHKPLFEKYGVDLYMTGHIHSYASYVPEVGSSAIPIVVTGAAGCDEGLDGGPLINGTSNGYHYYARGDVYQIGTLDVTRSSLTWKSYNSGTGEVFDSFTLSPRWSLQTVV